MPGLPRPLMKIMRALMVSFARLSGGWMVILTTMGARSGRPYTVALERFPEGEKSFLVVASNGGSTRQPAWFINMARHPEQVWAEVGKRKFKVRPQLLKGAERQAAMQRVFAASPGYKVYQKRTDREIPFIRLTPED
jgi:deazaflavin-dependent oxidoreductase (nitroreductase family)